MTDSQNIFGIVGFKNSGKTGLMERLIAHFVGSGLTVSSLKHAHHHFDVDQEGRDSFRHRAAGTHQVLLSSGQRWALMSELRGAPEPDLRDLLKQMAPVDLILVEGYKGADIPKLECHRGETGKELLSRSDDGFLAVASDVEISGLSQPVFDLNDTAAIAEFILKNKGVIG